MHQGLLRLIDLLEPRDILGAERVGRAEEVEEGGSGQVVSQQKRSFRATASHERHVRSFGGLVAAQALAAASASVDPERNVHSMHGYFVRPGRPDLETIHEVDILRDGRSFSNRRVRAVQDGRCIFELSASFHQHEDGVEHTTTMPTVDPPESLPTFEARFAERSQGDMERWFERALAFDIRYVGRTPFDPVETTSGTIRQRMWIKTVDALPRSPALHASVVTYASDIAILDAILMTHGIRWTDADIIGASLDHSMWFHQPFRADEWLLFDHEAPTAGHGRGLARAQIWTRDGRLVVSVAQEALLRPPLLRPPILPPPGG